VLSPHPASGPSRCRTESHDWERAATETKGTGLFQPIERVALRRLDHHEWKAPQNFTDLLQLSPLLRHMGCGTAAGVQGLWLQDACGPFPGREAHDG
jgi:hypothetical protein